MDRRYGHKTGNTAGKTSFPAEWTDQQIVNAVRDVLEAGDTTLRRAPTRLEKDRQDNEWLPTYDYVVAKTTIIDGVEINAMYKGLLIVWLCSLMGSQCERRSGSE